MHLDWWQSLGVVCGAILAAGAVAKKVVFPMWRGFWRTIKRMDEVGDVILGDKVKKIPSLAERMAVTEQRVAATEQWQQDHQVLHVGPGANHAPVRSTPSGGRA